MKKTTAENLEKRFDEGEDVLDYFETGTQRVNVDFPSWVIEELDKEAARRGTARQAVIKHWIVDRLDEIRDQRKKAAG